MMEAHAAEVVRRLAALEAEASASRARAEAVEATTRAVQQRTRATEKVLCDHENNLKQLRRD